MKKQYCNIYVVGVFDLFHRGHVELLRRAKELGQRLIVAVNSDEFVSLYKRHPVVNEADRLEVVKACKYVDEAFLIHTHDNKSFIEQNNIHAIVHGDDWERSSYLKQIAVSEEYLLEKKVDLILLPYTPGICSSDLIKKIKPVNESDFIYKQSVSLPLIYQLEEDNIDEIAFYLERNFPAFKNVAVLSGTNFSFPIAEKLCVENNWQHIPINEDANSLLIERLKSKVTEGSVNLIIGVGGGNIIDIGKRLSFLTNINFIAVPTIISNDGLISPISVIRNNNGLRESLPAQMPMGIVIDLKIIAESPEKYLKASAGDILTNLSATNDWILARDNNGDRINDMAYHISRNAATSLIYFAEINFSYKPFVQQIVQGQLYSGLAMALAGESRPCSGSEHLISHAIDYLKLTRGVLHGTQVASISLFSLYLQNALLQENIDYALKIEIPLLFHEFSYQIKENLALIFRVSSKMRPGRYTVLNTMSETEFVQKYREYCEFIQESVVGHTVQLRAVV